FRSLFLAGGLAVLAVPLFAQAQEQAQPGKFAITIKAGKDGLGEIPICVPLSIPRQFAKLRVATLTHRIRNPIGQLSEPSLITEAIAVANNDTVRRDLTFITPALEPGASITFALDLSGDADGFDKAFHWFHQDDQWDELRFGEVKKDKKKPQRPIARYM